MCKNLSLRFLIAGNLKIISILTDYKLYKENNF